MKMFLIFSWLFFIPYKGGFSSELGNNLKSELKFLQNQDVSIDVPEEKISIFEDLNEEPPSIEDQVKLGQAAILKKKQNKILDQKEQELLDELVDKDEEMTPSVYKKERTGLPRRRSR